MNELTKRGYTVKENWPVYYTRDPDVTLKWFSEILGWYGVIDERDESGLAQYGWVADVPVEMVTLSIQTRSGIHLFQGEPSNRVCVFMRVRGIRALRDRVLEKGWKEITQIEHQPWNSDVCVITTIDGCQIQCYETNNRD